MKEYQVVKVYSDGAVRNNQYICKSDNLQQSLETVMNIYGKAGWELKSIIELNVSLYKEVYVTFEK